MFSKNNLHWTTVITEKFMLAVIGILTLLAATGEVFNMVVSRNIELGDIFLLFIYTEIIGMIGAFYASTRIPVTLPIIIAITALCRLIVLHSKEADPMNLLAEAGAILILAGAAYAMSLKDKLSLEKEKMRNE
jgi:protein PsiE